MTLSETATAVATPPANGTGLVIRRPDDWHVHLRDGAMLQAVAPATARVFARAIVMPNLNPAITTVSMARAYRERILAAVAAAAPALTLASLIHQLVVAVAALPPCRPPPRRRRLLRRQSSEQRPPS